MPEANPNIFSIYLISVSFIGLFLLAALTFGTPTSKVNFPWQKAAIGSIFGIISLTGIIAGVYPSKCSRLLHFRTSIQSRRHYDLDQRNMGERVITFEGHHPSCGKFSTHVFQLGGKNYCAGCTGLVIGAVISLLGTAFYFSTGLCLREMAMLIFWLGFVGVALGLLQYNLFNTNRSFIHLSLNVIFVLGAFLLFIGIEETANNLVLEAYFVILTLYWILTRILLSQQEHRKICSVCGSDSCSFFK